MPDTATDTITVETTDTPAAEKAVVVDELELHGFKAGTHEPVEPPPKPQATPAPSGGEKDGKPAGDAEAAKKAEADRKLLESDIGKELTARGVPTERALELIRGTAKRRINELTGKLHRTEREKQELADRLAAQERAEQEAVAAAEKRKTDAAARGKVLSELGERPKFDDFDDMDKYQDAVDVWREKREKVSEQYPEDAAPAKKPAEQPPAVDPVLAKRKERYEATMERRGMDAEFEKLVSNKDLKLTEIMLDSVFDRDESQALLEYLGKNPAQAERIAAMAPEQIDGAIAFIAAQLADAESAPSNGLEPPAAPVEDEDLEPAAPRGGNPPPPTRQQSRAAPSITPVKPGSRSVQKDPSVMDPNEYRAWRESGGGR